MNYFKRKFIILLYHKIGDYPEKAKFPGLYVSEKNFDKQIKYLKNKGYVFLTLSEMKQLYDNEYYSDLNNLNSDSGNYNFAADASKNEKNKFVSITFDDGSRSIYTKGLKIIKNNNVNATVFMVSDLIGDVNVWDIKNGEIKDEMLKPDELREMIKAGIEIGAHTRTHPHLTMIPEENAYEEILDSKKILEEKLNININFFAYPYGDYNESVKKLVAKAGFEGAVITKTGIVKNNADFFALRRVAIRHNTDFFKFKKKIFKVKYFY
ncbi:MAG: polysaccharide deacetylase family protein [Candidatus Acididesulfobacter guangdongensis]|uniref:Polysaccharide deacetylase family protein n=1 Tax=Acididesulfobacter guangdongensis TaxID=2597225 RepID=A0A519BGP7_ACIG2|nr:MAG: polysaccharide deacetylase family protein [Candidatus Acididesulfobacter guangdongensis]